MMEELLCRGADRGEEEERVFNLPDITEYGIHVPFRFVVIGQTDSGKTYSIMRRWLSERISYWTSSDDAKQPIKEVSLMHCLYCSNGNVSYEVKQELKRNFVVDPSSQQLFHLDRFPTKEDVFCFIAITSGMLIPEQPRKRRIDDIAMAYHRPYDTYICRKQPKCPP